MCDLCPYNLVAVQKSASYNLARLFIIREQRESPLSQFPFSHHTLCVNRFSLLSFLKSQSGEKMVLGCDGGNDLEGDLGCEVCVKREPLLHLSVMGPTSSWLILLQTMSKFITTQSEVLETALLEANHWRWIIVLWLHLDPHFHHMTTSRYQCEVAAGVDTRTGTS